MAYAQPKGDRILAELFTSEFAGTESVLLASDILGATIMPHVIYLHSALTQRRVEGSTDTEKKILRFERIDVVTAIAIAGTSTQACSHHGRRPIPRGRLNRRRRHRRGLGAAAGAGGQTPAMLFGLALLASGFSSSSVGTIGGQVVMQGFINRRIPLFLRRLITMLPALMSLAIRINHSRALVMSQVVLSFGISVALVPLLIFCRNRNVMGVLANHRLTTAAATVVVALIVSLNVLLLYGTFLA